MWEWHLLLLLYYFLKVIYWRVNLITVIRFFQNLYPLNKLFLVSLNTLIYELLNLPLLLFAKFLTLTVTILSIYYFIFLSNFLNLFLSWILMFLKISLNLNSLFPDHFHWFLMYSISRIPLIFFFWVFHFYFSLLIFPKPMISNNLLIIYCFL